jgi:hypothetical protein
LPSDAKTGGWSVPEEKSLIHRSPKGYPRYIVPGNGVARLEFTFPHIQLLLRAVPVLLLFRLLAMRRYNMFHGDWHYTGLRDISE